MSGEENNVYRALQQHLDNTPVGFPPTESGVELELLRTLFTPQEAKIATYLKFSVYPSESIDEIFARAKSEVNSKEELVSILDGMARKGLIISKKKSGTRYYNNAQWLVGIVEMQVNKLSKEYMALSSQYSKEAFGQAFMSTALRQLRVIPIEKSLVPEHLVGTYDQIRTLVESSEGPFSVMNCSCRQGRELLGQKCKATSRSETCLGGNGFAEIVIEQGLGREITKDELMAILDENQREGLVLQPSNTSTLEFLCSCCGCCCGILGGAKATPHPAAVLTTNYYAELDTSLCSECGTCIDYCQMGAISQDTDSIVIDLHRCIGCGNCTANCPEGAIALKQHPTTRTPPKDLPELYKIISDGRRKQ